MRLTCSYWVCSDWIFLQLLISTFITLWQNNTEQYKEEEEEDEQEKGQKNFLHMEDDK